MSRGNNAPWAPLSWWIRALYKSTYYYYYYYYTEDLLLFPSIVPFVLPLDLYTFFNRGHLLTITANRGPIVPLCYKSSVYLLHISTHTHKLVNTRQTGSSHCSSFVYTLSQHLSYVLYTFGKRGPFSNWGPYCSFCYKSPVWMPKQTHTHTCQHCTWRTFPIILIAPIEVRTTNINTSFGRAIHFGRGRTSLFYLFGVL